MARKIMVICDLCLERDKESSAREMTVGLNRSWRVLDLCEEHHGEVTAVLERVFALGRDADVDEGEDGFDVAPRVRKAVPSQARKATPKALSLARRSTYPCLYCSRILGSGPGVLGHIEKHHLPGRLQGRIQWGLAKCPACGHESGNVSRLGLHIATEHDMNLVQVLAEARDNGDPYGQYARFTDGITPINVEDRWEAAS